MTSVHREESKKRLEALINFLQKHPKYVPSGFILNNQEDDQQTCATAASLSEFRTNDFSLQMSHIRNQAISVMMMVYGLSFNQVIAVTINDIDLDKKVFTVRHENGSVAYKIFIKDTTVDTLCTYLQVRPPTNDNKLFPLDI